MAKALRARELRGLPLAELQSRVTQAREELHGLRRKALRGSVEQPHRIRQLRRDVARLHTVMAELSRGVRPAHSEQV